jgi:hypothetical protein
MAEQRRREDEARAAEEAKALARRRAEDAALRADREKLEADARALAAERARAESERVEAQADARPAVVAQSPVSDPEPRPAWIPVPPPIEDSDLIYLRCSALPLALKCPGSVRRGVIPINASNDAADVGTAGHDGLATMVRAGRVDWDGVPELASKHAVDEKELRGLLALGAKLWEQIRDSFPNVHAESLDDPGLRVRRGRVVLTGHPDLISISGLKAHVGDWKTGRLDSDYREQLRGYMVLVLEAVAALTEAFAGILWVRDQDYEPHRMERADLDKWWARIDAEIVNWDGTYKPFTNCHLYCPRGHECPAANAQARRDMAIIMDQDLPGQLEDAPTLREMIRSEPDKVVKLVELARAAEKNAKRALDAIKAEVIRAGDIEGKEKRLTLLDRDERILSAWEAFPVLQEVLEDAEMSEVISISLPKAEEIVAKKAGKGNGAQAKRELFAKLNEAGAIKTSTSRALVIRRQA